MYLKMVLLLGFFLLFFSTYCCDVHNVSGCKMQNAKCTIFKSFVAVGILIFCKKILSFRSLSGTHTKARKQSPIFTQNSYISFASPGSRIPVIASPMGSFHIYFFLCHFTLFPLYPIRRSQNTCYKNNANNNNMELYILFSVWMCFKWLSIYLFVSFKQMLLFHVPFPRITETV